VDDGDKNGGGWAPKTATCSRNRVEKVTPKQNWKNSSPKKMKHEKEGPSGETKKYKRREKQSNLLAICSRKEKTKKSGKDHHRGRPKKKC